MDSVARPACCWRIVARHFARHSCAPLLLAPLPFRVPVPLIVLARFALWPNTVVGGLVARQGWGGGGAPDAGSGPSPREFPHGGADACTPGQGVTLLYGPSICTRSVQMDLRRIQVRRPFPTPGSGTLLVSGESLRDRHVSCLPRWTVCPTRSPSQDTNRSTCRGECSWSGPLATPPGQCHLGPLANGPGRNPHYCSRSDGADTDTGGGPKPQRSGTSPALFAGSCHPGPPPLVPASQISSPGASPCPAPLAVPPGSRHVPSAPAVCPCSGVLVSFVVRFVFFFFPLPPPMSPRCLLAILALFVGGRRRRGRGGGGAFSLSALLRKHVGSTAQARGTEAWPATKGAVQCKKRHEARHLSLRWGRGLPCGSCRHPTLPAVAPPAVPPLGLARRVLPLGTVVWIVPHSRPSASPPCRGVLGGGSAARYRHPSCPLAFSPLPSPLSLVGVGGGGRGGGRPRCPSSGVSTSQARHWHVARHLSFCWGVGHAAWPPSSPCPLCVRSPGAPPAGACSALASLGRGRAVRPAPSPRCPPIVPLCPREGGPLPAPPFLHPPPLGGRRHVGGGGGLSFSLRCSGVAGTRRGSRPSAGGGGFASRLPSSPLLPYARTPGGPPAGACTARALYGHGRVARPAPSYLCLPTLPRCARGGGGFLPPPYPHSPPSGGRWCWGGGGAPFSPPLRCTHVAGMT